VVRTGRPDDPGTLFVLAARGAQPVLGAPACAPTPKLNGFDWVLDRIFADIPVTKEDIAGMGVGGLLMEIPTRPQPREPAPAAFQPRVHVVLLAAGRSSRMGGPNKLLALFDGEPLVRRATSQALASKAAGVVVVAGHQSDRIRAALSGLDAAIVDNPEFATGLSSSLKAGVAALPSDAAGVLVVLGDMPGIASADLDKMIDAFRKSEGRSVVRAAHEGRRGNPVLLPRSLFGAIAQLEGDTGARHLVEAEGLDILDVEIGAAAFVDVDTPDAMRVAGGLLQD
jgi:molybdenum cofactor cytidylyltransferase